MQSDDDVALKSITFKKLRGYADIASVQCSLTNGQDSAVFEQPGGDYDSKETIKFDKRRPIRAVSAAELPAGNVWQMTFLNYADKVVKAYKPQNFNSAVMTKIKIEENQ